MSLFLTDINSNKHILGEYTVLKIIFTEEDSWRRFITYTKVNEYAYLPTSIWKKHIFQNVWNYMFFATIGHLQNDIKIASLQLNMV